MFYKSLNGKSQLNDISNMTLCPRPSSAIVCDYITFRSSTKLALGHHRFPLDSMVLVLYGKFRNGMILEQFGT